MMHLCKGSDKIEVIDIGLKSLGLAGLEILGIITAAFHCRGITPSATDWLNISARRRNHAGKSLVEVCPKCRKLLLQRSSNFHAGPSVDMAAYSDR